MRLVFGALALLVVVAIVGLLARTQLAATGAAPARVLESATTGTGPAPGVSPAAPLREQPQQVKQAVESLMQQARPMPDDFK